MTQQEKKIIIDQIYFLCEKQYRKGLQHGVHYSESKLIDMDKATNWRDKGYKNCIDPVNGYKYPKGSIVQMESFGSGLNELLHFLQSTPF